jgi:hypothetical protein
MSGTGERRFCRACGKYENAGPYVVRLSVRTRHYHDSPWREYLILGSPDGRWSAVGEGDYYVDPTDWSDIMAWLLGMHEYEALTQLEPGTQWTVESLNKIIRNRT